MLCNSLFLIAWSKCAYILKLATWKSVYKQLNNLKIFRIYTPVVILLPAGTSPALGGALHDAAGKGDTSIVKLLKATKSARP